MHLSFSVPRRVALPLALCLLGFISLGLVQHTFVGSRALYGLGSFTEIIRFVGDDEQIGNNSQNGTALQHHDRNGDDYGEGFSWPFSNATDVRIYLIHVGKAGGLSLYQALRPLEAIGISRCRMNRSIPDHQCGKNRRGEMSAIRRRLWGHFHMVSGRYKPEQKKWLRNNTNLLLVSVRDPVDRLVSAFNYHHHAFFKGEAPKPRSNYSSQGGSQEYGARIYLDCFLNAESLAQSVTAANASFFEPNCQRLGRNVLQGRVQQPVSHFYYNYQHYARTVWTNRSKRVAVVRTESLWQDLSRIEMLLGGNPEQFKRRSGVKYTHGSEAFLLRSGVSREGGIAICCAIRKEIQVYHDMIVAAVNLNAAEKEETLHSVFRHCDVDNIDGLSRKEIFRWNWESWHHSKCSTLSQR